ncbi:MAG TPA: T9SS type A sorting domain-containing protein [Ignavibacteria bacterium]|nr:T9SS type A sorting domain-containing protein [Ignavibacteria bacterium]HMQ98374.1 T9SS type A sorting domain-containing protein [Ignavibacteria bacterium]
MVIGDSLNTAEARSIIQTTDGGFIAVGRNYWPGGHMYIVKLTSTGQMQWSKTIGSPGGDDLALSVIQTSDGGYAVSGFGSYFGPGIVGPFIVKLTSAGTVEWARVLVGDLLGAAYSIVQTADGGYITANSMDDGGGTFRTTIVKLNNLGLLQWSKKIGNSYGRCIKQTMDRGYIVAGATWSFGEDMFVVKLDSNGTLQWAKTIDGKGDDFAYSIVQTTDGGYAVAGWTSSFMSEKMYITKLDSSGMLQWTKVFAVNSDRAYSIVQTIDGGYALAGYTGWGGGMLIVKLNSDGSLQWSRVVDGGSVQTYAYSIIQTSDGGYAAAGYGGIWGSSGMFIVKLDNNGNTCGNTVSHNISEQTGGILGSPSPTVTNISLLDTLVTPPTGSLGYVTPICVIGIQPISNEIPASYKLYQNYPNPFNPVTNIKFDIPNDLNVSIRIYDIRGRGVFSINEYKKAGSYEVQFDGTNFASGMYFYKMVVGDNTNNGEIFTESKKMVLLK